MPSLTILFLLENFVIFTTKLAPITPVGGALGSEIEIMEIMVPSGARDQVSTPDTSPKVTPPDQLSSSIADLTRSLISKKI